MNHDNPSFGRLPDEQASGHWLYAFLRYDVATEQRFLIVVNLHPTISLQEVRVMLPTSALEFLDLDASSFDRRINLTDRLAEDGTQIGLTTAEALNPGVSIASAAPLSAFYFQFAL